jgi:outer membrane lipoprotein-sorting protein
MARLKARWRVLAAALAVAGVVTGAVAVGAAQSSVPMRLAPLRTDLLIASMLRAIADGKPISGHVSAHVDLGLPALSTQGLPNLPVGAAGILASLSGDHRLRVWRSPDGLRISELLPTSDRSLYVNRSAAWFWDFSSYTAYYVKRPGGAGNDFQLTDPIALARQALDACSQTTSVRVGSGTRVAGRSAYPILIEPKTKKTLVRLVEIDVDATERLPLRVAVYSQKRSAPPLWVAFTQVSFDRIDPSTYRFTPPPGAKVRNLVRYGMGEGSAVASHAPLLPGAHLPRVRTAGEEAPMVFGSGWASIVAIRVPGRAERRMQAAGFDPTQFLPFSGPLFSIRLLDRGDHRWLIYGLVPQSALAAMENRLH